MFISERVRALLFPPSYSRRGAILAAVVTVIWAAVVGGVNLESGFGLLADFTFACLLAIAGIPLAAGLIALVLVTLQKVPALLTGFLLAAGLYISLLWFDMPGWVFAAILLSVECLLGATLATIAFGRLRSVNWRRRFVIWSIFVLSVAANVQFFSILHGDGIESATETPEKPGTQPPLLTLDDPSRPGPYVVKTLYYGSGDSLRRPEFGPSVAIRTGKVDASAFFKDFDGWKARLRKLYWGFGMDQLPLNAQVFYPEGAGPFPLFVMVHGNHQMSVASDQGYGYLCHLLASRGFIAVSVDENFLNIGLFQNPPKQQPVRAWLLLEHLRLWNGWTQNPKSVFYRKADMSNIALAGHSRGGEAAATAALFNTLAYYPDDATIQFHYGYGVKAVVAIAPPDGQYKPAEQWRVLKDVSYLTLQGASDSDLWSFEGSRQYDHVELSGHVPAFKSELYISRANHGQFNTMWGRTDSGAPENWFLNLRPLISGDAQRQVAKVYLSAFLEAALHGRKEYRDVFRDYRRVRRWLPATQYLNRFEDESYQAVCTFQEDADVTTTTVPGGRISTTGLTLWREGKIPLREGSREYNGVVVGWNWSGSRKPPEEAPSYSIDLPEGMTPVTGRFLNLSVAVTDEDAPETPGRHNKATEDGEETDSSTSFSIEAVDPNNAVGHVSSSAFARLPAPFHVQFTKLERLDRQIYKASAEPVFQTIRVPLSAVLKPGTALRRLRLVFDQTPSRVIIISGIGFDGPGVCQNRNAGCPSE